MEDIIALINTSKTAVWYDYCNKGNADAIEAFKTIHWDIQTNCLENVKILIESYLLKQLPMVDMKLFNELAYNNIVRRHTSGTTRNSVCILTGRTDAHAITPLCIVTDPVSVYKRSGNHTTGESMALLTAGINNISKLAKLGKRKTACSIPWEIIGVTHPIAELLIVYNELIRIVTNVDIFAALDLTCSLTLSSCDNNGVPQTKIFKDMQ